MKIERMSLHVVPLDQWGGTNRYALGQRLSPPLEANIVRIDAEDGLTGWGESCGIPPHYLPTLSPAVREAIKYVAPLVVGADARAPLRTMHEIEAAMRGQAPAKAAIDMALWDLCGKLHGVPLCDMWGGRVSDDMPVLAMVSIGTPNEAIRQMEDYRAQGYSLFQVKVAGGTVEEDIEHITRVSGALKPGERCWFDANRGWTVDEAVRVLQKVSHLGPLIEQPCETYQECLTVSRRTGLGLMLDEVIDSPEALTQAHSDGIIDAAVLKLGCVGGLTRQRHLAQVGARLGIPMRIEDYYGTGLTLAAVTHVAHTLPPKATFGLYDYHLPEVPIVTNPPTVRNGRIALPEKPEPGLGVEVDEGLLGKTVATFDPGSRVI